MKAKLSADGKYRVPWTQAWTLSNLSEVTAADTGEQLHPDIKVSALIGGLGGAVAAVSVFLGFLVWQMAFERHYGLPIAAVTFLSVVSLYVGGTIAASRLITFSPSAKGA